jgi:LysM repeat protein
MVSGRPYLKFLALSFVLAFMLAACVRPLSQSDEAVEAEATVTAEAEAAAAAGEGASEEGASEEGAAEEASTDGAQDSGAEDSDAADSDAVDSDAVDSDAADSDAADSDAADSDAADSDAADSDAEDSGAEDSGAEDSGAAEAESGDENVGGGTPDTAEEVEGEGAAAAEETTAEQPAEESPTPLPTTHTVAAGENLYRIGLKYGMSWVVLAQYNNLPNADRIYVGQVLQIPSGQPPPSQPPPSQPPEYTSYVVKSGDNLFRIGLAFGVSWVDIATANGIVNPNVIYPGQVLKIPTGGSPSQKPHLTHTVQPGETLFRISLRYGVSWLAIAQANNISSPYVIYPGQTLIIPSG